MDGEKVGGVGGVGRGWHVTARVAEWLAGWDGGWGSSDGLDTELDV